MKVINSASDTGYGRGPVEASASTGRHRPRVESLAWPLLGGMLGLVALYLGDLDLRWAVFGGIGSVLILGALYVGLRQGLLAYTLLGLSVDAHYYITQPIPSLYTGVTTPGFLSVPLALVPGLALLALRAFSARSDGVSLDYGGEVSRPLLLVVITVTIGVLLSHMRFVGLCVVWQYLCLLALMLAVLNGIQEEADVSRATRLLLVVLVGQCAVFLLQLATGIKFNAVGHVNRVAGEGGLWHSATGTAAISTAGFATFLDPLVMVAFAMYRVARTTRARLVCGGVFILGATVVVLTLNRSSWIALPIGIAVTELLLRRRGLVQTATGNHRHRFRVAVAALLVAFAITAPMFQSKRRTQHEDDLRQRIELMKPALNMIAHNPILGVGPGVYGYVLRSYATGYTGWLYIAHNEYLLILAERGLLGFTAYLLLLRAMRRQLMAGTTLRRQGHAAFAVGAAGGLAAHLWEIFWTSGMSFPAYGVMFVIVGISMGASRLERGGVVDEDRVPTGGLREPAAVG